MRATVHFATCQPIDRMRAGLQIIHEEINSKRLLGPSVSGDSQKVAPVHRRTIRKRTSEGGWTT